MTTPTTQYYRNFPDHPIVNTLAGNVLVLLADLYWHCNAQTGQLNPRLETLAHKRGWSYSKVYNLMRVLRDCGIVRAIRGRRSSSYEIRPTEEWHRPVCRTVWPRRKGASSDSTCECDIADSTNLNLPFLIEQETVISEQNPAAAVVSGSSSVAENPAPAAATAADDSSLNVSQETQALVLELAPVHPCPGNVHRAAPVLEQILSTVKDRSATIAQIRANHQGWRLYWNALPAGRFIPQLHRWLRDNEWQYAPGPEAIAGLSRQIERKPITKAEQLQAMFKRMGAEIAEREKASA